MMDVLVEATATLAPELVDWLERAAAVVLAEVACDLDLDTAAEACLVLTDDQGIHALNLQWRGVDRPTDVLSFPQHDGGEASWTPHVLGDIVISVDTARRVAVDGEHRRRVASDSEWAGPWTMGHELAFLVVHGALHLIGHDHADAEEEATMRAEEARVFASVLNRCGSPPHEVR